MASLSVIELGRRDYAEMVELQEQLTARRFEESIDDFLLLLEHPPTYTLGKRSEPSDLLHGPDWYRERGVAICETPRGGKVTYHGPGQLIAYPLVDLRGIGDQPAGADRVDVAGFVAALEESMAATLAEWDLPSGRIEGLTGLWVDDDRPSRADFEGADAASAALGLARGSIRKIGSIGLKIHRGVTSHGLAINVSCDLDPFAWINSCGIETCRATSIESELGEPAPSVAEVGTLVAGRIGEQLGLDIVRAGPEKIGLAEAQPADSIA